MQRPSAAVPSFTVAGWQPGTLLQSSNIIIDSLQEHPESDGHARSHSLVRSPRCPAGDLVVEEYFALCFHNQMPRPTAEKNKVQMMILIS